MTDRIKSLNERIDAVGERLAKLRKELDEYNAAPRTRHVAPRNAAQPTRPLRQKPVLRIVK